MKLLFLCLLIIVSGCQNKNSSILIENNQYIYFGKKEKLQFLLVTFNNNVNSVIKKYNLSNN